MIHLLLCAVKEPQLVTPVKDVQTAFEAYHIVMSFMTIFLPISLSLH